MTITKKELEIFCMNRRYIQIEKVKDNSWKSCVICYGHFTYLHAGHLRYLREASKMKDNILIVLSKGPLGDGSESDLNERVDLIMSMFGEVNIIYADNKEITQIMGKIDNDCILALGVDAIQNIELMSQNYVFCSSTKAQNLRLSRNLRKIGRISTTGDKRNCRQARTTI